MNDKSRVISRSSYALINIILAHASAALGRDNAFLFYHRCSHLLDMRTVQGADIETSMTLVNLKLQMLLSDLHLSQSSPLYSYQFFSKITSGL